MDAPRSPTSSPDLGAIRERLATQRGPALWRSLEELAGSDEFLEFLEYEFPRQAAGIRQAGTGRRDFLKLMSASLALAGLGACTKQPEEHVVPYVKQPERIVLGQPLYFATAMTLRWLRLGVVVEQPGSSDEGRGQSRASRQPGRDRRRRAGLGARSLRPGPLEGGHQRRTDPHRQGLVDAPPRCAMAQRALRGAGLRILTGTVTSPTLGTRIQALLDAFPDAR